MLLTGRIDKHRRSSPSVKVPREGDQRGDVHQGEEPLPSLPRGRTWTDWELYETDSIDPYPTRH
jgi:hypothetical protein